MRKIMHFLFHVDTAVSAPPGQNIQGIVRAMPSGR